jgi:hypothetical protein
VGSTISDANAIPIEYATRPRGIHISSLKRRSRPCQKTSTKRTDTMNLEK